MMNRVSYFKLNRFRQKLLELIDKFDLQWPNAGSEIVDFKLLIGFRDYQSNDIKEIFDKYNYLFTILNIMYEYNGSVRTPYFTVSYNDDFCKMSEDALELLIELGGGL